MSNILSFIHIFEILGVISFSISGSMFAIKNKLDLLGIITIAFITTFGGGILRDIFIGFSPPRIFFDYKFIILSIACSIMVFIIYKLSINNVISKNRILLTKINIFIDSLGLATFSVIGVNIILNSSYAENILIVVFVGTITAVGGGVVRDTLCGKIPYIFRRQEVYATASMIGSFVYYILMSNGVDIIFSSIISIMLVLVIRIATIKYRILLPYV